MQTRKCHANADANGIRAEINMSPTMWVGDIFVCVEVLRPSQPNGVMSSVVSLPNHTFTGQALSSKRLTSIVHIPLPETDNCPS